ncbi:MAG: Holliday junction branch migration protein RuvA [Nitrospirae bacterium]|nr:Holliday junction branch migration protein RuvA [Nitrospirota bacterium]
MIASLKGIVLSKKPDRIIVEVAGVGYSVAVPLRSLGDIPKEGDAVFMYTYTHVREDALQLFGFTSEDERRVFATLLGVTGVGPKLALAILSGMPVERFVEAIYSEDVVLLSSIPGLGKKTAARLVLELKGKLQPIKETGYLSQTGIAGDSISALVNLGYKRHLAEKAVETALKNGAASIEEIIKEALKSLTDK